MSRYKATLLVAEQGAARAATVALTDLLDPPPDAVNCFEEGAAWRVDAYFQDLPDGAALASLIADVARLESRPALDVLPVPDLNWVAISQAALPPVVAGRFTVHGRHDRFRVPRGPHAIEIDAGEAFGTAHHATTAGCLQAIDRLTRRRSFRRVLDLGCGTGVLAIAASRALPSARVMATDIDPVAIEVARSNIMLNGCGSRVRAFVVDGVPRGRFDLIVANILAGPLLQLAPAIRRAVAPGGVIVLSGLLTWQADEVVAAYVAQGFALQRNNRIAGWSALTLVRRDVRRAPRVRGGILAD